MGSSTSKRIKDYAESTIEKMTGKMKDRDVFPCIPQ